MVALGRYVSNIAMDTVPLRSHDVGLPEGPGEGTVCFVMFAL